ncbi:gamma-glutamylcyclotransferase [Mesorhizobium sp. ZMM04-5]|uniref:glutathione-specific gamma-glutamylcyclotransferase n=1 Tax=Mesorhizobium marinum TaxID=3228790 RepID=A0ABV3QW70_9HYPH
MQPLRLTRELVERVVQAAGDISPAPFPAGRRPATDADYDAAVRQIMAGAPSVNEVWVFAYGSLIWNPAFDFAERQMALLNGWHRSFCLGWDRWFRGSAQKPGLMLALDRGGRCKGVAFKLPPSDVEANLATLVRREIQIIPHAFPARWVNIRSETGPVRAVTFVIDRTSSAYVKGLSRDEVADVLACAVGRLGSMAEYLYSTVEQLEALGLHDSSLWQLQHMVAERIENASP